MSYPAILGGQWQANSKLRTPVDLPAANLPFESGEFAGSAAISQSIDLTCYLATPGLHSRHAKAAADSGKQKIGSP